MAKDEQDQTPDDEKVSHSATDLADRILTQGLVPAATEIVHLSQHSESERLRGAMSKVVVDYHLKKLLGKNRKPDEDFWEDFKQEITEEVATGAES